MRCVNVASKGEDKGEEEETLFVVSPRNCSVSQAG